MKWLSFIKYATNPVIINNNKKYGKLYDDVIYNYKRELATNNKVYDVMVLNRLKQTKINSVGKDILVLKKKINEYENIIINKDKEIEELYRRIKEFNIKKLDYDKEVTLKDAQSKIGEVLNVVAKFERPF